jgi:hypothetical protein
MSVDEIIIESMWNEEAIHFMNIQISFMTKMKTYFIKVKHHPSTVEVKQNTQEF